MSEAEMRLEIERLRVGNEANQEIIRQLVNALAAARVQLAEARAKPPREPTP